MVIELSVCDNHFQGGDSVGHSNYSPKLQNEGDWDSGCTVEGINTLF
ncbi:MAG TPA: hypothetical protein VEQ18_00910 [Candidatus Nitrosocosmicus sp.]|nr:hypothetical protein [Candidatus Nitrosocosmicus sp.]